MEDTKLLKAIKSIIDDYKKFEVKDLQEIM